MKKNIIETLIYNYKIKKKFAIIGFFIILIFSIVASIVSFNIYKNLLLKSIDTQLLSIAKSIDIILDNKFFDKAVKKDSITPKEDMQNIKKLSVLAKNMNVTYIYTMLFKDGKIYFTSSSALDKDFKNNNVTKYFDEYKEATPALKKIFKNNKILYETSTDEWGTFRSILIPKTTINGNKYIIGVDISQKKIDTKINKALYKIILLEILFIIILLLFFFFMNSFSKKELEEINEIEKNLEEKNTLLEESLENFRNIFDSAMEIIILSDENGNILEINQATIKILSFKDKSEIIGKNLSEIICDNDKVIVKRKTNNSTPYKLRLLTKNGKIIYTIAKDKNITINTKKMRISFAQDITSIIEKEEALQANKTKSVFLANMSHEIRTPLNAITGFIEILKENIKDEKNREYLKIIESSSESLLNIIDDILDFSKIESGKLEIDKHPFEPKKEFKTITNLFDAKASKKNINLILDIDKNIPEVLISDPLRIKQVIANLISNAIKFTPEGKKIFITIFYKNNQLFVSVKDEGIGIAKDKQKHIFEAFSQEDSSTTRKYGGTGLGLAISSKLVELLGGKLKLKSEVGKGSEFYFSIPVEVGKLEKKEENVSQNLEKLKGKKILLVEDNQANQMFMKILLKKLGFVFDIANDGVEAVEKYKNNKYDFILMDENMPNMNGIEATKKILKYEKENNLKHTPIIALTANAIKGDRERFLEAGMDEYLTKPLNKNELMKIFSKFL
jgi:PAS domain S-box-containing protein